MLINYLLLPVTFTIHALQASCFKEFSRTFMKNTASYYIYNVLYFGIVITILMVLNGGIRSVHPLTLILSIAGGIVFIITVLLYMKAMACGLLSFTILIFSCSMFIPVVFGVLVWKEKISLFNFAGLALLLVTLYLASDHGTQKADIQNEAAKKANLRWLLLCLSAMVGNGMLSIISKYHQMSLPGKEISEFLVLNFATACVCSLVMFFINKTRRVDGSIAHLKTRRFAWLVLLTGLICTLGNYLLHYLGSVIPASVLYPVMNGGFAIVSTVLSVLIFKEKLTRQALAGLLTGLCALALISIR
jgi:drug/metabolite transporter (DMT)-like permease